MDLNKSPIRDALSTGGSNYGEKFEKKVKNGQNFGNFQKQDFKIDKINVNNRKIKSIIYTKIHIFQVFTPKNNKKSIKKNFFTNLHTDFINFKNKVNEKKFFKK